MKPAITINYRAVKFNKHDTQYESIDTIPSNSWLTDRIKKESFQGFSNLKNVDWYFRLRGETSWKSGEQVTGLFKTSSSFYFYGNRRNKKGKTLILFFESEDRKQLRVCIFPEGYYPAESIRNQLIQRLK